MQKVKAVFVSHEHSDHIRGIPVMAKKYNLPIYITTTTMQHGRLNLNKAVVKAFRPYEAVIIGDLAITAFPKLHDASDPYSFIVDCNEIKVGVFTDIGEPCEHVVRHFKLCHAAFLESNYDDTMLETGRYPYYLKQRIRGEKGHLSNKQALDLFKSHKPSFMSHLFLSHLSKNNNCPKLVKELFDIHANGTKIIIASRFEETPLFHISNMNTVNINTPQSSILKAQLEFAFN